MPSEVMLSAVDAFRRDAFTNYAFSSVALSVDATTSTEPCGFRLPAAFCKLHRSRNIRGVLRIPAPSSILQALSKPQHPRIPTDSSSQHHFGKCIKATTSTDSYGFQLPAPFCKLYHSHNIHGVLRIPAPSMILQTVSKPQHPRIPTDSSSQHHFGNCIKATTSTDTYGFQLPAAFCQL